MADLDVVAEDPVEPDLQRSDAAAPSLGRLQLADPVTRAARSVGDRIQIRVKARTDDAAFPDGRRGILDQRPSQRVRELRRRGDPAGELPRDQR